MEEYTEKQIEESQYILDGMLNELMHKFNVSILRFGYIEEEEEEPGPLRTTATVAVNRSIELRISLDVLIYIMEKKMDKVEWCLYHEFIHINHQLEMRKHKWKNIYRESLADKTYISFLASMGFDYWTEFDAYALTWHELGKDKFADTAFEYLVSF